MSIQIRNTKYEIQTTSHETRVARHGFSLTEVLIAVGVLAVGMLFIAGSFPVSIHFAMVATERTIAPVVADEAFAKIKLYGKPDFSAIPDAEFAYPSTPTAEPNSRQYWWSAVSQPVTGSPGDFIVTVFISRKVGINTKYYTRDITTPTVFGDPCSRPVAVFVVVATSGRADELLISDTLVPSNFINDGYTIVDDTTGNIYRVLERYSASPNVIRLDKDWQGTLPSDVWVVPPPVNGGRYPCVGVYQKIMRF